MKQQSGVSVCNNDAQVAQIAGKANGPSEVRKVWHGVRTQLRSIIQKGEVMSTVVENQGWFSRIGDSLKGIVVGLLLSVVSVPLLFWNEGRAVKTAKGLKEGAGAVVNLESDEVASANEGKFVHVTSTASTDDVLKDEVFGVEYNGIRLVRKAETYQWVETSRTKKKKKLGGGVQRTTTYDYNQEWTDQHKNSDSFHNKDPKYTNPKKLRFTGNTSQANNVSLGGFNLPTSLVRQISGSESVTIDPEKIAADVKEEITVKDEGGTSVAYWRAGGGYDGTPRIGDTRIEFSAVPVSQVSVMSKQSGQTFEPYITEFDTELHMLEMGSVSSENMIAHAEAANVQMTWMLRGIGSLMMFFGFLMLLKPLQVFADVVPLFGSIVGAGTAIIAGLLAIAGSLTVISIAWIFYRPLLGIGLLAIAALAIFMVYKKSRGSKSGGDDDVYEGADIVVQ